ncbi:MAG: ROK family protein [Rickettsiales bacterium]|jgi:predicted NBD/HSP70 family sugar kinase|nr:ROK family protein [Rickettsiales bacterium]
MQFGFDIGGTKTEFCVIEGGEIIFRERLLNRSDENGNMDNIFKLISDSQVKNIKKIGFSLKGIINADKNIVEKTSLEWLTNNFIDKIRQKCKCEIKLQNDAKCFALAESQMGIGKGYKNGFYLILGTGVGSATIFNGEVLTGFNNAAGEIGHIKYKDNIEFEEILSGPGFSKNYNNLTPKEIMQEYRSGNVGAVDYFDKYMDFLAYFLHMIIAVTAPEIIVIGGGLSNIPEIIEQLPLYLKKYVYGFIPQVYRNTLGDSSGVIGACFL